MRPILLRFSFVALLVSFANSLIGETQEVPLRWFNEMNRDSCNVYVSFELAEGSSCPDGAYTIDVDYVFGSGVHWARATSFNVSRGHITDRQSFNCVAGGTVSVAYSGPVRDWFTGQIVGKVVNEPQLAMPKIPVFATITQVTYDAPLVVRVLINTGCKTREEGGKVQARVRSVEAAFSLGSGSFGDAVGSLHLTGTIPDWNLSTPATLRLISSSLGFTNRPAGDNPIHQVLTPACLVQVTDDTEDLATNKYFINYYTLPNPLVESNGLYLITNGATRFKQIIVANVDGNETNVNKLWITEITTQATNKTVYSYNTNAPPDQGWSVDYPNSLGRQSVITVSSTNQAVVEREWTSNAVAAVAYTRNTYTNYAAAPGKWLIESVADPDGSSPAKTTYSYYTDVSNLAQFGRVKEMVRPDGSWERYDYSDTFKLVTSSFRDSTVGAATNTCRTVLTTYATAATNPIVTVQEWVLGQLVSARYQANFAPSGKLEIRDITAWKPDAAWDDTNNLVTIRVHDLNTKLPISAKYPNGTMMFYSYSTTSSQQTTTTDSGQPNSGGTAIQEGTRTVSVVGLQGEMLSRAVYPITNSVVATNLLEQETYSYAADDYFHKGPVIHYLDGTTTTNEASCCVGSGPLYVTDKAGTTTSFSYDALDRETARQTAGITLTNIFDAAGRVLESRRLGTDQSTNLLHQTAFDLAGRPTAETNALTGRTTYSYSFIGSTNFVRTISYPDGGTRTETYFVDGQLKEVGGTAARPVRFDYGVEADGSTTVLYELEVRLDSGGGTNEWTKTYFDAARRPYKVVGSAPTGSPNGTTVSYYNWKGQVWKQVDPDGVVTLFAYNGKGELEYRIVALDDTARGETSYASMLSHLAAIKGGTNRITWVTNDVFVNYGTTVRRTRTYAWSTDNTDSSNLLSTVEISADGLRTWQTTWNGGSGITNQTQIFYGGSGSKTVTNIAADGSLVISAYQDGRLASFTRQAGGTQLGQTTYAYDVHGRPYLVTDARDGASTLGFNNADQVTSVLTPAPDAYHAAQYTQTRYDNMGRVTNVVYADNTTVTNEFWPTGLPKRSYGSRTYPAGYGYNAQGQMTTLTNWTSFIPSGGSSGTRVTAWQYDNRGFLTNKVYDGAVAGPSYTYQPSGRLLSRTWERGTSTTYGYNNAGDLASVAYANDPTGTPNLTYAYDRRGRQSSITPASGTTVSLFFNDVSELTGESYSGGVLAGLSITNSFDSYLRRTQDLAKNGGSTLATASFGYDAASRLTNVTDGTYSAGYAYLANSPLVGQITFSQSGTAKMVSTRNYDLLNRLTSISSSPSPASMAALPVSFGYDYNDANQRIERAEGDGSFWQFRYDGLGQVVSGRRYWDDNSPVAGQLFEYSFDQIGNRTGTKAGGDANGNNLRSASYTANSLNQYSSRSVPNAIDVVGVAHVAANVTVNGAAPTSRHGDYFQSLLTVGNSGTAVWQGVTDNATLGGTSATNSGYVFVPQATENFSYDADGNDLTDGRWNLTWDAENRLVGLLSLTNGPANSKRWLGFGYDPLGRRISKRVQVYTNGAWSVVLSNKFLYDGWNLVAELNATNNAVIRSFMWGLDLSGSEQGVGGVGGFLAVNIAGSGVQFTAFDGNGNVAGLYNPSTATWSARYEYGAFGELIRSSGALASANPFRFSTKYQDDESGFSYYGRRYYSSSIGRWLSRDPIGEVGGYNLYVLYDPVNGIDVLGLIWGDKSDSFWVAYFGRVYDPRALAENITSGDSWRTLSDYSATLFRGAYGLAETGVEMSVAQFQALQDPIGTWDKARRQLEALRKLRLRGFYCYLQKRLLQFDQSSTQEKERLLSQLTGEGAFLWASGEGFLQALKAGRGAEELARLERLAEQAEQTAANGTRALRLPATDATLAGTETLGYTTPSGDIFLQPGLSWEEQLTTLRHESVHVFFSPEGDGAIATLRQSLGQWGYDNSQLLRYTEEATAETYGSGSLIEGLRHPFINGYGITPGGLLLEGGVVGGGLLGAGYLGYQLGGGH